MKQLLNKKISKVLRKSSTLFGSNTFFYLKKPVTKFKMAISTIMRAPVIQLLSVVYLVALSVRLGEILEHVPTYKDYWTIIAGVLLNLLHLIAQWYLLRFYVHRYHYFIICKKLLHNIRFQPDSDSNVSLQIPLHHPRVFIPMSYFIWCAVLLIIIFQVEHLQWDTHQYRLEHLEWGSNIHSKIFQRQAQLYVN